MGKDNSLSGLSFDRPIPQAVRAYGRAIDPNILEPGDLMLFARKAPTWSSRRITQFQLRMFSEEHARWSHAAVSGGRYEICEATIWGVKTCEYWKYMTGEYDIKIRRLKDATQAVRSRLAFYAASNANRSYGLFNILNAARGLRSGETWQRATVPSRGVICSQLYFEASMRVGYLLANIRPETACPAHLSMSSYLEDVELSWVKV